MIKNISEKVPKLFFILLFFSYFIMPDASWSRQANRQAEWTIMIFLNAKNNLEAAGLSDFLEMAEIGSDDNVNIVVQFGRPASHYTSAFGGWSGVKRYLVKRGDKPTAEGAVMNVTHPSGSVDMGNPDTLVDFLNWSRSTYPARRYALIIWNHGQGWRFQLNRARMIPLVQNFGSLSALPGVVGGFRSVSHDEDTGNILYNREIQDALSTALNGNKLDVIGFDACLMAMVETAVAMRNIADYLIASEELEPGDGWQYDLWLASLVKNPSVDGAEFGRFVVDAYRERYRDFAKTTLSTIRLSEVSGLSTILSSLSDTLLRFDNENWTRVRNARHRVLSYGDGLTQENYVDVKHILDEFRLEFSGSSLSRDIDLALNKLNRIVISNYRSKHMVKGFGSHGISIFFPYDRSAFLNDLDREGYYPDNQNRPVEFVSRYRWACFIMRYVNQIDKKCMN